MLFRTVHYIARSAIIITTSQREEEEVRDTITKVHRTVRKDRHEITERACGTVPTGSGIELK